jgi:hypothetical protein
LRVGTRDRALGDAHVEVPSRAHVGSDQRQDRTCDGELQTEVAGIAETEPAT